MGELLEENLMVEDGEVCLSFLTGFLCLKPTNGREDVFGRKSQIVQKKKAKFCLEKMLWKSIFQDSFSHVFNEVTFFLNPKTKR